MSSPQRVRAKFRLLSILHTYEGIQAARLVPVKRDGKDGENSAFWKYTPSGELRLDCRGIASDSDGQPLRLGDYYYLDFTEVEPPEQGWPSPAYDGVWSVSQVTLGQDSHQVDLHWSNWQVQSGLKSGALKLGLTEQRVVAMFGEPTHPSRGRWLFRVSFAETSDDSRAIG